MLIYGLFQKGRVLAQDGVEARIGTLTAGREWFKSWRTITGETLADPHLPQLQVMLACMCDRYRFLALVRDFIVFEDDGQRGFDEENGRLPPVPSIYSSARPELD